MVRGFGLYFLFIFPLIWLLMTGVIYALKQKNGKEYKKIHVLLGSALLSVFLVSLLMSFVVAFN